MNAPVSRKDFWASKSFFTRESPLLARRDALARPSSFNPTARTIEVVFATGAGVQRTDERGQFLEILSLDGADLQALIGGSVLNAHNQFDGLNAVIGNVLAAWREGDQLIARLQLSERPELEGLVRDIGAGIIASVSVGYEVETWQDGEASGQRTRTATKWRAREISFVPVSADPAARTRAIEIETRASVNRQIRALAQRAGVGSTIVDDLIDREASVEEARAAMFENMLTRGSMQIRAAQPTSFDDPALFVRSAGEALYARTAPHHVPSGPARQFIGTPLPDIARECLRRSGVSTNGLWGQALITRALGPLGGLHTTSDFPAILADTANRTLREAYAAVPSPLRALGRQVDLPDFRTRQQLMLDSSGFMLERLNEHAEIRSGTFAETGEGWRLESFARIFGITFQALTNDDLGAFSDISRRLGQAASAFEDQFLTDLLLGPAGLGPTMVSDQKTLFHADHGNLADPGSKLSEQSLSEARVAFYNQVTPSGGLIAVSPRYLIVGPALLTTAEKLLAKLYPPTWEDVNVFSEGVTSPALQLIVEPRLRNSRAWYLVADPRTFESFQYGFLSSAPGPQVEMQQGFRVLGLEYRVVEHFGAGFTDWRGVYLNKGGAA